MASSLRLSSSPTPFFLFFFFFLTTIPFSSGSPRQVEETHLHFFFHESNSPPNQTSFVVTSLNSDSSFGKIIFIDDTLREGPETTSKLIGRAQGTVNHVGLEEAEYLITLNFVFTEGKYNGSTLAVFGRAVFESDRRDWSIIGGTGQFWFAQGYALGKKLSPPAGLSLLLEFDVRVWVPVSPYLAPQEIPLAQV